MASKRKVAGIATGVGLVLAVLAWMFTAPYLGLTGL